MLTSLRSSEVAQAIADARTGATIGAERKGARKERGQKGIRAELTFVNGRMHEADADENSKDALATLCTPRKERIDKVAASAR